MNSRMKHLAAAVFIAIAAIVVGLYSAREPRTPPDEGGLRRRGVGAKGGAVEPGSSRLDDLAQRMQISQLKQEVARLEAQIQRPPEEGRARGEDGVGGAPIARPGESIGLEERRAKAKAEERARVERLDALLHGGPVDRAWADAVAAQAERWASENTNRAAISAVTCGDRFCRAEVLLADPSARDSVMDALTMSPPFNISGFVYVAEQTEPQTLVYFTREGVTMADVESASAE